jgi:putative hemolysin
MKEIDLKEIINGRFKNFMENYPKFIQDFSLFALNKIMHINEVNSVIKKYNDRYGFDFIDDLFEHLDFSFSVKHKDRMKIPAEGKLIIVSNHPLGGLDGLLLLKLISEIRTDVRIVANDILLNLENLSDLFLPLDIFSPRNQIKQIKEIEKALTNDEAVIIFPAAEVSRMSWNGIKDNKWMKGAVKLSKKQNVPILPLNIDARNSISFYLISMLNKRFSMLFLTREIFKSKGKDINILIGDPISSEVFQKDFLDINETMKLLKKHVYKIGKGKKGIFKTEKNIIHPVNTRQIRKELFQSELLGTTVDNKMIFLTEYNESKNVMQEISRLRELTFRKVGEGTGKKADMDKYDKYYKHIVLWDDDNLNIVGSYRLGLGKEIMEEKGITGFYNSEQFLFYKNFFEIAMEGMELGRSFIQQKYWRSAALDYLWQGIGAFLNKYPSIRYLFGAVSISNSYSDYAKKLIISYYLKWYNFGRELALAKNKMNISRSDEEEISQILNTNNHTKDFRILKTTLMNLGFTVPVLYRRYTNISEFGATEFLDFNIDKAFNNAVDGFILVDLSMIKEEKKERYYKSKSLINSN